MVCATSLTGLQVGAKISDTSADRALAIRILSGDDQAFEELVERHRNQVIRIASRFFRRSEIIEEVCQDVFLKAYTGMRGYRAEMPLEHWLSRIAVNACYDQLRRQKKELSFSDLTDDPIAFFDRLTMPQENAEEEYWEREETRVMAERILARLSPADRVVITLMILEERPVSEIANLTGWSKTNVKVRAFRARAKLRKIISRR